MTPDIDVTWALLLRERDPDQAVGVAELDTGDERRAAFRIGERLLMLEPVADASAEELGDACPLRLAPAEARLEIACAGSLVLEQAVKRQPGSGERHGDRRIIRQSVCGGRRNLHASMVAADSSRVCYEARATSSRAWRRDTTCEIPSGPIVTP